MDKKLISLNSKDKKEVKELKDVNTYIALGNFDGLHKGHMTLINKVVDEALLNDSKSMVYTFTNHPLTIADPSRVPKLIMDMDQKLKLLGDYGIDYVALIDFTMEYMKTSPEDFIKHLLADFNAKGLVCGFNYRYGYLNKGNVDSLEKLAKELNFDLIVMPAETDGGEVISSTRIRALISDGNIEKANELLLEPFMLKGEVITGKQNGRKLGFPTANQRVNEDMVIPKIGVYYTNVRVKGELYKGITSVGTNPTIADNNKLTVETYILNFDEDIYGETIEIYFIEWMRPEEKYDSLDDLIKQLTIDNNLAMIKDFAEIKK